MMLHPTLPSLPRMPQARQPTGLWPGTPMAVRATHSTFFSQLLIFVLLAAAYTLAAVPPHEDANGSLSSSHRPIDASNSPGALIQRQRDSFAYSDAGPSTRPRTLPSSMRPSIPADLVLSNIVILTSVEGGLFALDRTTGEQLWSLSPHSSHSSDSLLRPLVTGFYGKDQKSFADIAQGLGPSLFSDFASGSLAELEAAGIYIVEPSSAGDIYVLSSKPPRNYAKDGADSGADRGQESGAKVSLDKLPLTLPQLVELSPFSFAGDDSRVFVGQKQTTLVELDVRTGKLGAVFGGREGGVWCGARAHQPAAPSAQDRKGSADADACIDDEPAFGAMPEANEWAYVGRTDYTLNIHSRNSPELLQTLHFSTFAPNAGDRDIQSIWYRADHPDDRAIMGMPEDGSVVCFNLSSSVAEEDDSKTLWMSDLRASVAGIFDVVYPAPHLQNTKSMSRPILVSHPPVPLSRIFPQIAGRSEAGQPVPSLESGAAPSSKRSAYLGIAGNSLFAMSGNRFPLVAFTSKAVAGLPEGHAVDDRLGRSALPPSDSSWANDKKCASFGCWLGRYTLEVDASAEGAMQDSLLGSDRLLEIDGGDPQRPTLAIGDKPAHPSADDHGSSRPTRDSKSATPASRKRRSSARKKTRTDKGTTRPSGREDPDTPRTHSPAPRSGDEGASEPAQRSWKTRLMVIFLQLMGLLVICILSGTTYIGFEQQRIRNEQEAANIAKQVVWIPVSQGSGVDASKPSANAQASVQNDAKQLGEAGRPSKQGTTVASREDTRTVAQTQSKQAADSPEPDVADDGLPGGAAAAKKRANKRRRRGKRAGAAAAARAAKAAKDDGVPENAEAGDGGADDSGDEDDDSEERGARATSSQSGGAADAKAKTVGSKMMQRSGSSEAGSAVVMDDGGTPRRSKQGGRKTASARSQLSNPESQADAQISPPLAPLLVAPRGTPQLTQALMSPQLTPSAMMESGWPAAGDRDDSIPTALGEQVARMAAAGAAASAATNDMKSSSLYVSEKILGYGSSGTIVFRGTFQGRTVAVKRLLRDFVHVASKEVSLLESADNHPNVIRYFYKELTPDFLFIALELCPASLADVVERPHIHRELSVLLEPKRALHQITSGLRHLHSLSIVHRDIKPQNILVTTSSNGRSLKMLLSDFGLSKRLDGMAQTSFTQTANNPGGTVGWRAPEILRGDINLDPGSESESSLGNSSGPRNGGAGKEERQRLTRAVDIFALGCLAYYVLSNGDHPFGTRFEREHNIIERRINTSRLDGLGEEGHEARHLVMQMVDQDARKRPSADQVLTHPYFWDANKRLNFLQDASDRFEIMEKNPPTAVLVMLESKATQVLGHDWHRRCDKAFLENLGKFRKYDATSVQDLLRAMRNKKHHYQDLPPHLKWMLGALPDGFLAYFTRRFPELFLHVHDVITAFPLIRTETMFREYFVCPEEEH
ncbi:bifunctional endoribonuclease/protein kinase ire1 [Thecaphora frezii]